jgi:hypothetical protein
MRTYQTAKRAFGCASRPAEGSTRIRARTLVITVTAVTADEKVLPQLSQALSHLVDELDGRVLEDMMPGASTTLLGIASWVMERLALPILKLQRVLIEEDGHGVAVERDVR